MCEHNQPKDKGGKLLDTATWDALKAAGYSDNELYEDQPFGPIIYSYTRKQAIEDGVLVDLTRPGFDRLLKLTGITIHTVITATAFGACVTHSLDQEHVQQTVSNLLRLLVSFRRAADQTKERDTDRVFFKAPGLNGEEVSLWALVGPGDEAEPVLTIMLEGED